MQAAYPDDEVPSVGARALCLMAEESVAATIVNALLYGIEGGVYGVYRAQGGCAAERHGTAALKESRRWRRLPMRTFCPILSW